ncbi:MAG: transcription termination factor Rho [Christensenellaceae bacterium]|jgi:transcription termination factor Rho|nr:transcription termination factor Rho [Christensenellaceae bacterium]
MELTTREDLENQSVWVLRDLARRNNITATGLKKADLISALYEKQLSNGMPISLKNESATEMGTTEEVKPEESVKKRLSRPYKPDIETLIPIIRNNPQSQQSESLSKPAPAFVAPQNTIVNENLQVNQLQKSIPNPANIQQSQYGQQNSMMKQEPQAPTYQPPTRQYQSPGYGSQMQGRPQFHPQTSYNEAPQTTYNQNINSQPGYGINQQQNTHERPNYSTQQSYGQQMNPYQRDYQPRNPMQYQQRQPYQGAQQHNSMQNRAQTRPPYSTETNQSQYSQRPQQNQQRVQPQQSRPSTRSTNPQQRPPQRDTKNPNFGFRPPINDTNSSSHFKSTQEPTPDVVEIRAGILEICPDGFGFLRASNYQQGDRDAYIAALKIKKYALRKGDYIVAQVKKTTENRPWNVLEIESINGQTLEAAQTRKNFDSLTPIFPDTRYTLELPSSKNDYAIRAIDLVAPIGKGQRGMIVSPPKAGKTTLLKKIAHSISINYPEAHLIVLLVDERPEEVTDMQRSINGEVVYSTFDETPEHHTKAAEMVLERAKRLTELGNDVVIIMDSLTRLARAYNLVITPTGKTLSGGIDPGALHNPKRFFGAARNIENGGSLTIIATALVDTGSRMDDVIYEEFKGTGNMEIHLDRKLSEKRIFPAIDLNKSGTRREELLLDSKELEGIWAVRKMLSSGEIQESTESLLNYLVKSTNNKEFIDQLTTRVNQLAKEGFIMR